MSAARGGVRRWLRVSGALALAACTPAAPGPTPVHESDQLEALRLRAAGVCCRQRARCDLPPRPFTTDRCSVWPDGDWFDCCVEHDIAYWCGGPDEERARADEVFRACVGADRAAWLAAISYVGVRAGGAGWMPFPWRWGYGWAWLDDPR